MPRSIALVGRARSSSPPTSTASRCRPNASTIDRQVSRSPARRPSGSSSDARTIGALVISPLLLVTYAIGLFLGVPVIARELERGTVRLAWWLTPSRWRWYLARLLPILGVVVAPDLRRRRRGRPDVRGEQPDARHLEVVRRLRRARRSARGSGGLHLRGRGLRRVVHRAGLAGGDHRGARRDHRAERWHQRPRADPRQRGGRRSRWTRSTARASAQGDKYIDQKFVLPDGTLVGYDYFFKAASDDPFDENGNPRYPMVNLVIPGERYRFVEAREAARPARRVAGRAAHRRLRRVAAAAGLTATRLRTRRASAAGRRRSCGLARPPGCVAGRSSPPRTGRPPTPPRTGRGRR